MTALYPAYYGTALYGYSYYGVISQATVTNPPIITSITGVIDAPSLITTGGNLMPDTLPPNPVSSETRAVKAPRIIRIVK